MIPPKHDDPRDGAGAGRKLREGREKAGLGLEEAARQLKVPTHIVAALEAEDWARIGAPVFVRGHLRSYSRLLGLPVEPVQSASGVAPIQPSSLFPRTQTPLMQRLSDRVGGPLLYIVITALMVVLPIWVATHSRPDVLPEAASLDLPAGSQKQDRKPGETPARQEPATVVASMGSLPPRQAGDAPMLTLRLQGDSWVQVVSVDGSKLEEALLRAGDTRSYPAGKVARVVVGNAAAVEVRSAGQVQDLAPYQRANVARFAVSFDGSLEPVSD